MLNDRCQSYVERAGQVRDRLRAMTQYVQYRAARGISESVKDAGDVDVMFCFSHDASHPLSLCRKSVFRPFRASFTQGLRLGLHSRAATRLISARDTAFKTEIRLRRRSVADLAREIAIAPVPLPIVRIECASLLRAF